MDRRAWLRLQLSDHLGTYSNDFCRMLQLNEQLPPQVAELHACGITKSAMWAARQLRSIA
jgi:hypothetical protein